MSLWNWGTIIGWAGAAQCIAAAIGYALAKDVRRSLYYVFACAITVVIIWPSSSSH
jgi:hypothetical protein